MLAPPARPSAIVLGPALGLLLGLALGLPAASHAASPNPKAVDLYKDGIAKKTAGDLPGAQALFEQCLVVDSTYGRCHFSLGVLLKQQKDLAGAETHFRAAVAAYPTWGQAHLSLAQTLIKRGDTMHARMELETAVADPDLERDDRAQAWNARGVLDRQDELWADAVRAYDKALEIDPSSPIFTQNKALAQAKLEGQLEAAIATSKRAVALSPKDPKVLEFQARLLSRARRWADAAAAFRTAATLSPETPEYWLGLGDTAYEADLKPDAIDGYEHYLKLAPANVDLRGTKARLEKLKGKP